MFTQNYPVSVYRSSDKGAPKIERQANSVATILKACLVTGYGDKAPAGWTLDEDVDAGIKQFRPPMSAHQAFTIKTSNDTGREMTVQVYDGDALKMQCDTPFKYGVGNGKNTRWCVLACERGFWFFSELTNNNNVPTKQSGVYLYCGDTTAGGDGERGVYLKHTGGTWGIGDDDRHHIFDSNSSGTTLGKLWVNHRVYDINPKSFFNGNDNVSRDVMLSPMCLMANGDVYFIPAFGSSRHDGDNQSVLDGHLCHSTASHTKANNIYVPMSHWGL